MYITPAHPFSVTMVLRAVTTTQRQTHTCTFVNQQVVSSNPALGKSVTSTKSRSNPALGKSVTSTKSRYDNPTAALGKSVTSTKSLYDNPTANTHAPELTDCELESGLGQVGHLNQKAKNPTQKASRTPRTHALPHTHESQSTYIT